MTARYPSTTHTQGTTYSRAGLCALPAGTWSATATVKKPDGTLVQALDVNLSAFGAPDGDGNTHALSLLATATETSTWPLQALLRDIIFTDASATPVKVPAQTVQIVVSAHTPPMSDADNPLQTISGDMAPVLRGEDGIGGAEAAAWLAQVDAAKVDAEAAAGTAQTAATTSTTQAGIATGAASDAAADAIETAADRVQTGLDRAATTASAASASTDAGTASAAASAATGAASTATTKAGEASAAASTATSAASTATTKAGEASAAASAATGAASTATTKAGEASTSAAAALASETAAATSASTASGAASTATTKASEASASASSASGSAGTAATAASTATTAAGTATTQAGIATAKAAEATALYDSFDDRYLGAKSAAPAVDNDGGALLVGALYWDTPLAMLRVWTGAAWSNDTTEADARTLADQQLLGAVVYATDLAASAHRESSGLSASVGAAIAGVDARVLAAENNNAAYDLTIEQILYAVTQVLGLAGVTARAVSGGDIILRAGTADNPSLSAAGDVNTGMFFPGADAAALATAGLERIRVDASGNVGIGTTTPSGLLDVADNRLRVRTAKTPASATAAGNTGEVCWDASYIYVCTATNTWRRSALSTW